MRLTPQEVGAIKAAARLVFGPDATVRVFGSRVDDTRKGGDIDIHVEAARDVNADLARAAFLDRLFARIDEQRVDIIMTRQGDTPSAIERIAYRDGIVL